MDKKILIVYASRCGSTKEVAESISQWLTQAGQSVDLRSVKDRVDIQSYSAVVLGTAIRISKPLPETLRFAKKYQKELNAKPVACFSLGLAMQSDTPEHRADAQKFIDPVVTLIKPVSVGLFGGLFDAKKVEFPLNIFMSKAASDPKSPIQQGDFRDWDAIHAWASELPQKLSL
jgi:menaquinone-dependent protoporphyrinogen oxidase